MKEINLAKNITLLRKKKGITQEQLAQAINVSSQAVSKWETNTSQPDVQTMPLIADYFQVSIDYLYYGNEYAYDDLYQKNFQKVASLPQMCDDSYTEALHIFSSAHHGISHGNVCGRDLTPRGITHISSAGGVSVLSGDGYGALVTRDFFTKISTATVSFAVPFLKTLADETCMKIILAILSMSEISFYELLEKLQMEEDELQRGLDVLIDQGFVISELSKHKSLGYTYKIYDMYHSGICLLLADLEVVRKGLNGISCCMGYGDYPITI